MTTLLGAIADDFTGATDLAGLLARSGAPVSLRIGTPTEAPSDTAPFEVIALKIRTNPVQDAVAQALGAQRWLKAAGAQRFFWKYCSTFDSTAQGNIGPVAEALMDATGAAQTIYCPAFPENGRTIFMGNLFVGQTPLGESPMKDHPLTPMRDSNLMRLLGPQCTRDVGLIDRLTVARGPDALRAALAEAAPHVVVDAVADADLAIIAEACRDHLLMTGGSAVAMPLPDLYRAAGLLAPKTDGSVWKAPQGPALVLSGSCSAMTQTQVARFAANNPSFQLDPLALAAGGTEAALAWLGAQTGTPLIYATAAPEAVRAAQSALGRERAGQIVEDALASIAAFARDKGTRRFVVAGGESAGAVTTSLGVTRLDIGPEIAPGVPWCRAKSAGHDIAITLKSGNFGDAAFFETALAKVAR